MIYPSTDLFSSEKRIIRWPCLFTVFFLTLTGFGQMPIFKRYYIADLPGMGWLAQFYVTHYIHYIAAVILFTLVSYVVFDYLVLSKRNIKVTASGYVRGAILAGLMVTGIFLVIRNFSGTKFSAGFIIFLDLSHLGLVMSFLMVSLYCLLFKKKRTTGY
jgi:hypothetical protein